MLVVYNNLMIKETLQTAVAEAVKQLYKIKITPVISYPEHEFGDFSTNVAYQLASKLKQAPTSVAGEIAKALKTRAIASVNADGGFINIKISNQEWADQLATITPKFAFSNSGKGKTVVVEFISANPTGPLTLGNGRGGYSGDILANVLT